MCKKKNQKRGFMPQNMNLKESGRKMEPKLTNVMSVSYIVRVSSVKIVNLYANYSMKIDEVKVNGAFVEGGMK